MPRNLQKPVLKTWLTVAATATTATSAALALPMADAYTVYFNVTTGSGTTPTLDIVFQTSFDGGTTYGNIPFRLTQITGTGVAAMTFRLGLGVGEAGAESVGVVADTGGTLYKPCVFDPNFMKLKYTIGGTNPSFAFTVYYIATCPGSTAYV